MLASLGSARGKAREAAVQATLRNMIVEAELYYTRNNNSYANLCNEPQIQTMLNSIRNMSGGLADCYTHSGQNLHNRSWGAAATINSQHFAVNSQGVVRFDEENSGSSTSSWSTATDRCANLGKKLAAAEQLRSLYNAHVNEPSHPIISSQPWSSTEVPGNPDNVYRVNMGGSGAVNHDTPKEGGSSRPVRCVS